MAAARSGARTALVVLDASSLGRMSCNPAVGGLGKGQLVRELDALGGEMGLCTDAVGIQFRMLNRSKGPAVRAPRAQVDREAYNREMVRRVRAVEGLSVLEGEVVDLLTRGRDGAREVRGVRLVTGEILACPVVVLTTGTFLGGVLHEGERNLPGGRHGEPAATALRFALAGMGLRLGRHKTGTPPRLDRKSLDLSRLREQPGDDPPPPFSFRTERIDRPQVPCHLTATNPRTHRLIAEAAHLSPMARGKIQGPGPRYCPSVEDKVLRFPQRNAHQVFLEPEGYEAEEVYPNGISTSLPAEVQEAFVRTIEGLEEAVLLRPGYAVEYDHLETAQLRADLSVAGVAGLFAAGQINGTSGYEEAAVQGFIAGINAVRRVRGERPFVLGRDEAYIGVLIDDLVRVNPAEPYRMFTSRAEHRLALRQGNADLRLRSRAAELGLLGERVLERTEARARRLDEACALLAGIRSDGKSLDIHLRRPGTRWRDLASGHPALAALALEPEDEAEVEARTIYASYLERFAQERERLARLAETPLPPGLDYASIEGLKTEAREVLGRRRPLDLREARDLPGVTPADLSVLLVELKRREGSRPAARS